MKQRNSGVSAVVLGAMQDGGLPHIGCACPRCRAAFENPALVGYAASLAIVDRRGRHPAVWMIDATPDIKWQLAMLAPQLGPDSRREGRLRQPDGLFLTHAHLGHIGGLPQFGPEAMAVRDMPLFGTPPLIKLLQETTLWRPLVSRLIMRPILPGDPINLAPGLTITAVPVPHRDEWQAGTVAYRIDGPRKKLLYLPDIDDWDLWPEARETLTAVDVALVDASFFSPDELGGRAPVAHPLVPDTLRRFADIPGQLFLTHINHTNPILDRGSAESKEVLQSGVKIAHRGLRFSL
jgi:pyrroloquinoline quinone biosynthesis protein B